MKNAPNISGVPKEIQENIISDLEKGNDNIKNKELFRVGISISPNEDLGGLGYSEIHLKDITIEIVRHLLINNNKLVYAGDLREEGYTHLFSDLSFQYRSTSDNQKIYFQNYFSYPIYCNLTQKEKLEFKKNRTEIIPITPPKELKITKEEYIAPDSPKSLYIWSKSLTKMREEMILNSDARILIGGKCNYYLGKKPGIIQEAEIAINQEKPLYLIGAFGGASKQVIDALTGKSFSYYDSEFHRSKNYTNFRNHYNKTDPKNKIDVKKDFDLFKKYGIKKLSKKNGLSVEENKRLFTTPHLSEIIYYVFKGINSLKK